MKGLEARFPYDLFGTQGIFGITYKMNYLTKKKIIKIYRFSCVNILWMFSIRINTCDLDDCMISNC